MSVSAPDFAIYASEICLDFEMELVISAGAFAVPPFAVSRHRTPGTPIQVATSPPSEKPHHVCQQIRKQLLHEKNPHSCAGSMFDRGLPYADIFLLEIGERLVLLGSRLSRPNVPEY